MKNKLLIRVAALKLPAQYSFQGCLGVGGWNADIEFKINMLHILSIQKYNYMKILALY